MKKQKELPLNGGIFKKLSKSFANAFRGLLLGLFSGTSIITQLCAVVIVTVLGFVLRFAPWEWVAVVLCFILVISLELINTAIEKLCDWIEPGVHKRVRMIKDIAAGAVLWSALGSVVVFGILVFGHV